MGPELGAMRLDLVSGVMGTTIARVREVLATGVGDVDGGLFVPDGGDLVPFGPSGFTAAAEIIPVLVGIGFVVAIVLAIRNAGVYLRRGIDPTTVDAEMKARLLQSPMLAGGDLLSPADGAARPDAPAPRSVEERLAEIDRLAATGAISDAERAAARAEVLRDL
ncbi:hypothetical protein [Actinotalea sp.]|uniref:hypothetical protein n=1 Tax=Actinotalea sp. TaxID=1872145 RepID=UPI003562C38B